nr:putative ORF1 [Marmot picobirnavirus]
MNCVQIIFGILHATLVVCSFVREWLSNQPSCTHTQSGEILFLGGGMMTTKQILRLLAGIISKRDKKILSKAAAILVNSDRHDDYFYQEIAKLKAPNGNEVGLGVNYTLRRNVT